MAGESGTGEGLGRGGDVLGFAESKNGDEDVFAPADDVELCAGRSEIEEEGVGAGNGCLANPGAGDRNLQALDFASQVGRGFEALKRDGYLAAAGGVIAG